jgi:hypothetical protein
MILFETIFFTNAEMSAYTCGGSFCNFITKILSLQHLNDESVLCPSLKFVSGEKINTKVDKRVEQINNEILQLNEEARKLSKATDGEKIKTIKVKIEALQAKQNKIKALSDTIDMSQFKFIDELMKAMTLGKNEEEIIQKVRDPELKGLMMLVTDKSQKFEEILEQYEFGVAKQDFDSFVKEVAKIVSEVKKYKPKVFNKLIARKIYDSTTKKIDFKKSKQYCLNKYNQCFETCFKAYVKGQTIDEVYEANVIREKDKKTGEIKVVEEKVPRKLCESIYAVLDLNEYKSLPKEKTSELQESFKILNDVAKTDFRPANIKAFVELFVKVMNEMHKLDLEETFLKSVIKHTRIQLSNQTKYKLLQATGVEFVETPKKYDVKDDKLREVMEFSEGEFSNISDFSELTSPKTYATFGSIKGLNLSNKMRTAVGIRMVSELLKELQKLELIHHAKGGFVVTVTY